MSTEMQIIVASYETSDGAKDALKAIKHAKVKHGKGAILSKSEEGKVKVKGTWDWGIFAGAFAGAAVGTLLPIPGGAILGGVLGGLAAKHVGRDFPKDRFEEMAESLETDHSMLFLLVDSDSVQEVERALSEDGAQFLSHPISAGLMAELEKAAAEAEAGVEEDSD